MDKNEIWKSVGIVRNIDFTGWYEVSNMGRVRSLDRATNRGNIKGRILTPSVRRKGYLIVVLCRNENRITIPVHRLVLQTFEPNPNPKEYTQINHKDENPANNRLNNLEWCTPKYNNNYGGRLKRIAEKTRARLIPIVQLDLKGNIIDVFYSKKDISERSIFSYGYMIECINQKFGIAGGYFWIKLDKYNELTQEELLNLINENQKKQKESNRLLKPVIVLDTNDNFIKQFDSIKDAASFLNCVPSTVSACLTGVTQTAKGYKCMYLEEYQKQQ